MFQDTCICIPARLNSSRLDRKLLLTFNKKTCIEKTIDQCLISEIKDIFLLTDSYEIIDLIKSKYNINIIHTEQKCINGTDRIYKHLDKIPDKFKYIINVQADEPFICPENINYALKMHLKYGKDNPKVFYTTLHEECNSEDYLKSTASLKLITDINDNALIYSRNIIPWNKENKINKSTKYKTFTGIYVYNRNKINQYKNLEDSYLQHEEDCEQLRIIENSFLIKSYKSILYNEISLNTIEDYHYLINKYSPPDKKNNTMKKIKFVVFDLDGVFTDGKIYISDNLVLKCYNGKDTYGLKLLKDRKIRTGLITSHKTSILEKMTHVVDRMDHIDQGSYKKIEILNKWLDELNIQHHEVAYIGDDLNDKDIISSVGFSACPSNAHKEIKKICDYICVEKGGDGAVREFCDLLISDLI